MNIKLWLIRIVVWQKPIQHCKAIFLQLKEKKADWFQDVILQASDLSGNNNT